MPIAHIYILEGRTKAQKTDVIAKVTEALSVSLDSPKDRIRVILHETSPDDWGVEGVPASSVR
jgi:4-oxalocrotonate tautomerase